MDGVSNKQEFRKAFIARRQQLSVVDYETLNQQLLRQFQQLDLRGIACIHLFLPIRERKEPDTFLIRDWLKEHFPHIRIVFPKADFEHHTMESFADDDALELVVNAFDIPEPVAGNQVSTKEIDIVILPLLAFDKQGYRVGYGKGFYDRFLMECKPECRFIGLSFFDPVEAITHINEFDVRMHRCITPEMIYAFNSQ